MKTSQEVSYNLIHNKLRKKNNYTISKMLEMCVGNCGEQADLIVFLLWAKGYNAHVFHLNEDIIDHAVVIVFSDFGENSKPTWLIDAWAGEMLPWTIEGMVKYRDQFVVRGEDYLMHYRTPRVIMDINPKIIIDDYIEAIGERL